MNKLLFEDRHLGSMYIVVPYALTPVELKTYVTVKLEI